MLHDLLTSGIEDPGPFEGRVVRDVNSGQSGESILVCTGDFIHQLVPEVDLEPSQFDLE